jgi:hypothetical protein
MAQALPVAIMRRVSLLWNPPGQVAFALSLISTTMKQMTEL